MSQVTLTRVFRKDVDTKYGIKPKLSIQTDKHGDKWLSTFKVAGTENWQEGDVVNIDVQEKGDFMNFVPRTGGTTQSPSVSNPQLEERVSKLEAAVFGKSDAKQPVIEADDAIDPDDIPFGDEDEDGGF